MDGEIEIERPMYDRLATISDALILAPRASRTLTVSVCPNSAERIRGVMPVSFYSLSCRNIGRASASRKTAPRLKASSCLSDESILQPVAGRLLLGRALHLASSVSPGSLPLLQFGVPDGLPYKCAARDNIPRSREAGIPRQRVIRASLGVWQGRV